MPVRYDIKRLSDGKYSLSHISPSGMPSGTQLLARSDLEFYVRGPVLQRALQELDSTGHAQVLKGRNRRSGKKRSRSVWTVRGGLPDTNRSRH